METVDMGLVGPDASVGESGRGKLVVLGRSRSTATAPRAARRGWCRGRAELGEESVHARALGLRLAESELEPELFAAPAPSMHSRKACSARSQPIRTSAKGPAITVMLVLAWRD
jgi:hypothetical protein